jgi:molecular chaperone DnaK (HSP70)
MSEPRHAVGIDLGTTHCALAFVDLERADRHASPETFPVPQPVAPGELEALPLLPSFLYLPHPDELEPGALALPWSPTPGFAVGTLARTLGERTPIRLVSSAKSWLCVGTVDRRGPILPPDAPEGVDRLSPFETSVRYLRHLREAWDLAHPDAPLRDQNVVVTVPASFDPAARELTAEAAEQAGIGEYTLLEEPQAALYSWVARAGEGFREAVEVGDLILVVDVGGGTTDLSLIAVGEDDDGHLALHRIAVGDHILLGGDNMDLALAHRVRAKLEAGGRTLDAFQMNALTHSCRQAKERLLSEPDLAEVPIAVASRGSRLVGGTLRTELTRDEVTGTLVDGFFPEVEAGARPQVRARTGLTQLGLPYAQDPAMTRHLAAFLGKQARSEGTSFVHPTAILFNGGVFKADVLRHRVVDLVNRWLTQEGAPAVRVLEGAELDLACARGAAYYAWARRAGGLRIRGGTALSYYVGVETSAPAVPGVPPEVHALCVAPFGLEEGQATEPLAQELGLVVGEPVRFRFFGSSVRREDTVGAVLTRWDPDELTELGAIEATLPADGHAAGEVVPVRLRALVTEVGTLRLEALPRQGDQRWKVELDVRGE